MTREDAMLLNYLESIWAAVAFAEAGEYETAKEIANISEGESSRIPQQLEVL